MKSATRNQPWTASPAKSSVSMRTAKPATSAMSRRAGAANSEAPSVGTEVDVPEAGEEKGEERRRER